jgi:hypothetical protein
MTIRMADNGRQRLTSWKEIASHMGRDVRTVLRWEKHRGLPVHRVPGATGRVVFAYTDELDAWSRGGGPEQPDTSNGETLAGGTAEDRAAPRPGWRVAPGWAVVVVVLAGVGAIWLMKGRLGGAANEVAQASLTDALVQATAADGHVLWTYPIDLVNQTHSTTLITDVNGDGHADVVANLIVKDSGGGGGGVLLALDHRGRKLWEQRVEDTLTFGRDSFGPPWAPDDLIAYDTGGQRFVAWALHHHTWWPSVLAVFNGRGERSAMFVNAGWIRNVLPSGDGRYLLAGGISNSRAGASFAILDAAHPGGASPEDAGSPFECRDCPRGVPIRYFVIPWTDVIDIKELGGRRGQPISYPDGTIELHGVQYMNAEMIVELTPSLEIKRRRISDGFWERHAELERAGMLQHSRETCPFRNGPTVFEWTPELGWRELKPDTTR